MAMETSAIACPALRVPLVRNTTHPLYDRRIEGDVDNTQEMQDQFKHVIMQYHTEQLSFPKPIDRINDEVNETPLREQYFESSYKNSTSNQDGGRKHLLRLSHPEPLMSSSNFSEINQPNNSTSNTDTAMTKDIFPVNKTRTKYASTEKLPPIFSQITPRRSKKYNDSKLWLGPPNSIPPNKRNEHIAAYQTIALRMKSNDRGSARSNKSWTQLQQIHRERQDNTYSHKIQPLDIGPGILKPDSIYSEHDRDGNDTSVCSIYSDNSDTFSETNESMFRHLKSIDTPMYFRSGRASNASSIHVRSMPDLDSNSKREYTESNFGNYSTKVVLPSTEHSYLEDISVNSSTSFRNKKSVHFAPDVREISRETRAHPLSSGSKYNSNSLGLRLPLTYSGSAESVDQLPAVVEKFTIKSLPILPNIPSAMNVNTNIIYIRGDGQMKSVRTSAQSQTRRNSYQSFSGSYKKPVIEEDFEEDEEEAHKRENQTREIKVSLPSTAQESFSKTATTTGNTNSSPTSSQPNSNRVLQSKKTAANPPKKTYTTAKKVTIQKSKVSGGNSNTAGSTKKAKKPRNGSETSSRTSTNSSSPIMDIDDPESKMRDYSQAMLAVQARMREFDNKFGSSQKIEIFKENDENNRFGKVVVPSATITKQNKGKG